jgi:hypothetical protein
MTASTVAALPRVRVMFDVNVYLDLAQLFQVAPADLSASFGQALRRFSDLGVYPHPCYRDDNRPIDSLRATALACDLGAAKVTATAARRAEPGWAVCVSDHIVTTVLYKLQHGDNFGWPAAEAGRFIRSVVVPMARRTSGAYVKVVDPLHCPPLDREDGLVMASAIAAQAMLLVTCDGPFVEESCQLGVTVEFCNQFIDRVLRSRRASDARSVGRQLGWHSR